MIACNSMYKNAQIQCANIKQYIKEYVNLGLFGFPILTKVTIISKFKKITTT